MPRSKFNRSTSICSTLTGPFPFRFRVVRVFRVSYARAPSRRPLSQLFEQLAEIARGHGAILVRRAVIDEQRAADDDRAARETAAAIEPLELVVRLRLHQPIVKGSVRQQLLQDRVWRASPLALRGAFGPQ